MAAVILFGISFLSLLITVPNFTNASEKSIISTFLNQVEQDKVFSVNAHGNDLEKNFITIGRASILSYKIPSAEPDLVLIKKESTTYTVKQGDTLSSIAEESDISLDTLLWTNNLTSKSYIHPGDEIEILPISGLKHTVKKGETISLIANKYDVSIDRIIEFNNLPADAFINIGDKLIIPGGEMPAPVKLKYVKKNYYNSTQSVSGAGTGKSHTFFYGQCTWYVAQKRIVPWSGHAKAWLTNAQAMGYSVCWGSKCSPRAGAIVSLMSNSWLSKLYGHVAYVERINGNKFLISEMNYIDWNKVSTRWISIGDYRIRGFIY
jgi:LysM repeat protein